MVDNGGWWELVCSSVKCFGVETNTWSRVIHTHTHIHIEREGEREFAMVRVGGFQGQSRVYANKFSVEGFEPCFILFYKKKSLIKLNNLIELNSLI